MYSLSSNDNPLNDWNSLRPYRVNRWVINPFKSFCIITFGIAVQRRTGESSTHNILPSHFCSQEVRASALSIAVATRPTVYPTYPPPPRVNLTYPPPHSQRQYF